MATAEMRILRSYRACKDLFRYRPTEWLLQSPYVEFSTTDNEGFAHSTHSLSH